MRDAQSTRVDGHQRYINTHEQRINIRLSNEFMNSEINAQETKKKPLSQFNSKNIHVKHVETLYKITTSTTKLQMIQSGDII